MTPHPASEISLALEQWCVWQATALPPLTVGEGWGEGELSHSACGGAGQGAEPWPLGQVLPAHGESPDVGFLPLLQRRRLSPLARAALATVWPCRGDHAADLPAVFASSHGESHAYYGMLEDLAAHRELSPSRFSLSVHNAIAGLYSQFSDNRSPLIVLAPGREGPFAAFLEAAGLLLEGWERVLVVCYEQPLPEVYQPYATGPVSLLALAMRVGRGSGTAVKLRAAPLKSPPFVLRYRSMNGGDFSGFGFDPFPLRYLRANGSNPNLMKVKSGEGPRLRLRRTPTAREEQRDAAESCPLQNLVEAIRAGQRRGGQAVGPARWEWSLDDA